MASTGGARNIYKLYVHNVPWTVSHNELKKFFSQFGHVYSASVIFDKKTGLSRNYGFVNYSTKEGYETALNSNNLNLEGHVLKTEPSDSNMDDTGDLDELSAGDHLTDTFNKSATHLQTIVSTVDSKSLLILYGYYKQATEGPCKTPRPSWYDAKGRAKWDAWKKIGDMSQAEAMTLYNETVQTLDPDFVVADNSAKEEKTGWAAVSTMKSSEQALNDKEKTLSDFVKEGNCREVRAILQSSEVSAANSVDEEGMSLLHWAADRGCAELIEILISFGADVNARDSERQTPLHYAASCSYPECVKVLLEHEADVHLKDVDGQDARDVASDETIKNMLQ